MNPRSIAASKYTTAPDREIPQAWFKRTTPGLIDRPELLRPVGEPGVFWLEVDDYDMRHYSPPVTFALVLSILKAWVPGAVRSETG